MLRFTSGGDVVKLIGRIDLIECKIDIFCQFLFVPHVCQSIFLIVRQCRHRIGGKIRIHSRTFAMLGTLPFSISVTIPETTTLPLLSISFSLRFSTCIMIRFDTALPFAYTVIKMYFGSLGIDIDTTVIIFIQLFSQIFIQRQ